MNSFHRADWLSLSQTVGTVLAVVGAYGVAFLQHSLERRRAKSEADEQARQYLRLAYDFTSDSMRAVNVVFEHRTNPNLTETNPDRVKYRTRISQCLEALMTLQIEKLPTIESARQVIRARAELAYAMNIVNVNLYGPGGDVPCSEDYGRPLRVLVNRLQDATKKLSEELARFS